MWIKLKCCTVTRARKRLQISNRNFNFPESPYFSPGTKKKPYLNLNRFNRVIVSQYDTYRELRSGIF